MKACKQRLRELKKYENIIKKKCKKINIFLKSKKKGNLETQRGMQIVFRYLNPSYYIKAN